MTVIRGEAELFRNLARIGGDMEEAVDQGVRATAEQVRSTAIKSIQEVSPGRLVTRFSQSGREYQHVAAGPGLPPNTDTGALVRSIAVEHVRGSGEAFVGTSLDYGRDLELGTVDMQERPWLDPALAQNIDNLPENVAAAVRRKIARSST